MKVAIIEEQLKDVEEAKRNFMDIVGPKFQELKLTPTVSSTMPSGSSRNKMLR